MKKSHLFLDHLRGQELITMCRPMRWWDPEDEILFENLDRYGSPEPDADTVTTILRGMHERKSSQIQYQSRRKDSSRLISLEPAGLRGGPLSSQGLLPQNRNLP